MTVSAAVWQLDRLSTSAREAAEIASLGTGVSLSVWLTRLIGEACTAEGVAPLAEPPKILEFTRDLPNRVRMPIVAPIPANIPTPASVTLLAPATSVAVPAGAYHPQPPIPQPPAAPQPATAALPVPQPVPVGATMVAVAAMDPANLGVRRGEDIPEALLADIATRGVRQPVTVRRSADNPERHEIICGHRRWRAAQRVGLAQIPANVVALDDAAAILASLTENLQLGNLSVVDEAQAYLRLLTQCVADASSIAAAVGRDRNHIVRSLRLLGLPPLVRHLISSGMLSREHAYLLLDAPNPEALADAILAENLSVDAARQRIGSAGTEAKS
jgi:ParB/RepB/Spo0J family partition protein